MLSWRFRRVPVAVRSDFDLAAIRRIPATGSSATFPRRSSSPRAITATSMTPELLETSDRVDEEVVSLTASEMRVGVFDDYMFDVSETEEDDILAELRQMLFMSVPLVAGALYGFELFGNGTKRHVPPQKTKAEAVKALQRELRNLTLNYLEWGINDVAIRVIKPDVSVGKGGRSFIQASKTWVIVSPNTKTNCVFSACELSINRDKYKWLLEKGEKRLVQRSADLKHRVNPSNKKRTHMDDLQDIADYKKTEIVLYNKCSVKSGGSCLRVRLGRRRVES